MYTHTHIYIYYTHTHTHTHLDTHTHTHTHTKSIHKIIRINIHPKACLPNWGKLWNMSPNMHLHKQGFPTYIAFTKLYSILLEWVTEGINHRNKKAMYNKTHAQCVWNISGCYQYSLKSLALRCVESNIFSLFVCEQQGAVIWSAALCSTAGPLPQ